MLVILVSKIVTVFWSQIYKTLWWGAVCLFPKLRRIYILIGTFFNNIQNRLYKILHRLNSRDEPFFREFSLRINFGFVTIFFEEKTYDNFGKKVSDKTWIFHLDVRTGWTNFVSTSESFVYDIRSIYVDEGS